MKKDSSGTRFIGCMFAAHAQGKALHGRFVRRSCPSADLQPGYPALRAGGDVQQDRSCDFPSAIRYVDLGSSDLLAAKADGTENVLRV